MLMDCDDDDDAAVVLLSLSLSKPNRFPKMYYAHNLNGKKCNLAILLRYIMKCVALWNV